MMPHLGVLSTVHEKAAWEIFEKDCLVKLGTVIAPRGARKLGEEALSVTLEMSDGETINETLAIGDVKRIPLDEGKEAQAIIEPRRGLDVGEGPGHRLQTTVAGGVVGLVLDARGRPLVLPEDNSEREAKLLEWFTALSLYPEDLLKKFQRPTKNSMN